MMPSVSSSSLSFSSGMTSLTSVSSDSLPSSMSRMMTVAVHTFEIEPIWKIESFVAGAPVEMFLLRVPNAPVTISSSRPPRRRMPSCAPGTLCRSASTARRRCQCAASIFSGRGPAASPAYCSTHSTTRVA